MAVKRQQMRLHERNNSADTKVTEEGVNLSLQLVMKTMVRQVVPLWFMEVHCGADIHL